MANRLKNTLSFVAVAAGAQATLPHRLNVNDHGVIPDELDFDNGNFSLVSADATNVTMQNDGSAAANCTVLVEHWHSFERVFGAEGVKALTPQPFVGGGGAGGDVAEALGTTGADVVVGTAAPPAAGQVLTATSPTAAAWAAGGVTNPMILQTGTAVVDAPAALASAAIGHGYGDGTAEVEVGPAGSGMAVGFARAYAPSVSRISADELGSFASGTASGLYGYVASAYLAAEDYGSTVLGYALAYYGTTRITASQAGGFATGAANGAGYIEAAGYGAFAGGSMTGDGVNPGVILANRNGSLAFGESFEGVLKADAGGAFALGSAYGGEITASSAGAFAMGSTDGDSAYITSSGDGSFAMGCADDNGGTAYIEASGDGSFAMGHADRYGTIEAVGNGALAMGYANDYSTLSADGRGALAGGYATNTSTVEATGKGSFAWGYADGATISATGLGSVQFGPGTNAVPNSMQLGSDFLAKANGQFGGKNDDLTLGAAATTFATTSNLMTITGDVGGNTIATITGGIDGQELTLIFVDALVTITDNNAHAANSVDLSAAFTSADDVVLKLVYDGTSWYEVSRSVN